MGIRVMIGSSNNKIITQLTQFLQENGMQVVGETTDAYDLLRKIHTVYPDIAIIDDRMKGMKGYEISETILAEKVCPVVALIHATDVEHYVNLNQEPIFTSIVKPCGREVLMNTISLLAKTSKSILSLEQEVVQIKEKKNQQEVIDEAKRYLIKYLDLTEEEAHRKIQKKSMDKGLSKVKVAEIIIRIYKK